LSPSHPSTSAPCKSSLRNEVSLGVTLSASASKGSADVWANSNSAHNTDLKGGLIASTQQAIDDKKNSLVTGSLTQSDIQNADSYKASGYSIGASISGKAGDQSSASTAADKQAANSKTGTGLSPGIGSVSGSQASTTQSGISGAQITITDEAKQKELTGQDAATALAGLNREVTSEKDNSGALKQNWDGQSLMSEVQAQVQITSMALPRIANEIGTQMDQKFEELKNSDPVEAAKYAEGGAYRIAAHAALGALGGGVAGAAGAGVSAALTPTIADAVNQMGLPEEASKLVIAAAGTAVGAVAGGTTGAVTGGNQVVNNFLSHAESSRRLQLKGEQLACTTDACRQEKQQEIDSLNRVDAWRDAQIEQACQSPSSTACQGWTAAIQVAAASYQGQYGNLLDTAERSSVLNQAFKYQQAVDNPFLHGVGKGLLKLTPPGIAVGAVGGVAAASTQIYERGLVDAMSAALVGMSEIPQNIRDNLSSPDPTVRGEALVDVMALGAGVGAITTGGVRLVLNQLEASKVSTALAKAEAEAIAKAKIENNVNADTDFAGGVPVRPRDGQVPSGTAQIDTPIAKHLIDAEIKTNRQGQPSAVSGGHNMDNFNQTLQANGGQVIGAPREVSPGIYQVEYRLPGTKQGEVEIKTVYDPSKYSDQQMASMANEAVGRAVYQWNKAGTGKVPDVQLVEVNGVKFEVPISSYKGKVYVPTAYPSGK
jgi:filamentous hemagglutinin